MRANSSRKKVAWTKRLGAALAVTAVVLTTVLFYTSIFSPFARKYEDYEAEIRRLRNTLASSEESRADFVSLHQKVEELNTLLTDVRDRIPDSPNETLFLQQVTRAAKASNVRIRAYNRGRIQEFATHAQLEVHIAGEGGYQPICRFINELSKLSRITSIEQLKMEATPDSAIYPIEMRLLLFFNRSTSET